MVLTTVNQQAQQAQYIDVSDIELSEVCQPRTQIFPGLVDEYAETLANWFDTRPVVVFDDGEVFWLADGWHRFLAAEKVGMERVPCVVHRGSRREAILYSVGSNADHGQRRSPADKRKAIRTLLLDEDWRHWSDREIGRQCLCDHKTVAAERRSLLSTGEIPQSNDRKGADGRTTDTSKIGKSKSKLQQTPDPIPSMGTTAGSTSSGEEPVDTPDADDRELDPLELPPDDPGLDDPDEGDDGQEPESFLPYPVDSGPITLDAESWIESLPLYAKLAGVAREVFGSDADLFRVFMNRMVGLIDDLKQDLKSHDRRGAFHAKVRAFLSMRGPNKWVSCPPESSGGCGGTGESGGIRCHACRGRGYRLNAVASQKQIALLRSLGIPDGAALDPGTASELIDANIGRDGFHGGRG